MNSISQLDSPFDRMLRALRKIPRPMLTVFLAFALGLGINTGVFTLGYLKSLALHPHPEELVALRSQEHRDGLPIQGVPIQDFINWRQQATVFQDMHASTEGAFSINPGYGPEKVAASLVTPGFYRMMGDRFYLGYDFIPEDGDQVVILAHAMWKRLGGNEAILGTTLLMDGEPFTVAGVLAPGVRDRGAPVTVPLELKSEGVTQDDRRVNVIARLNRGMTIREAQANLDAIATVTSASVEPIGDTSFAKDRKLANWLLLGGVAYFVLIECVTVANLLRLRSEAGYRRKAWKRLGLQDP
jgi:putative ABC transport system permease protein